VRACSQFIVLIGRWCLLQWDCQYNQFNILACTTAS